MFKMSSLSPYLNAYADIYNGYHGYGSQDPYARMRLKRRLLTGEDPTTPDTGPGSAPTTTTTMPKTQLPPLQFGQPNPQGDDDSNYMKEFMRLSSEEGPATSAYKQALSSAPDRNDYKPSRMRSVFAGLAAAAAGYRDPQAGLQIGDQVQYGRYYRDMQDYEKNLQRLQAGAQIEGDDEDKQLKNLNTAYGMRLKFQDYQLARDKEAREGEVARTNAKTAQARADAYIQAQGRPDYDYIPQIDGSILAINKRDRTDRSVIPAQTVSAYTAQSGRISANASARSADAAAKNADTNARRANIYQDYVGKYGTTRPQSATDQTRAMDLALRQMYMDPQWRKFIVDSGNGIYDPGDPSDFDPKMWQLFQEELEDRMGQINGGGRR